MRLILYWWNCWRCFRDLLLYRWQVQHPHFERQYSPNHLRRRPRNCRRFRAILKWIFPTGSTPFFLLVSLHSLLWFQIIDLRFGIWQQLLGLRHAQAGCIGLELRVATARAARQSALPFEYCFWKFSMIWLCTIYVNTLIMAIIIQDSSRPTVFLTIQ